MTDNPKPDIMRVEISARPLFSTSYPRPQLVSLPRMPWQPAEVRVELREEVP